VASNLRHIPGSSGLPLVGHTYGFFRDFLAVHDKTYRKFGEIARLNAFFMDAVSLYSPEAVQFVMQNKEQAFSNELGYHPLMGDLFSNGLMLMDFDNHRYHRRIMLQAFKKDLLEKYLEIKIPIIEKHVSSWPKRDYISFFPALKKMTVEIAAEVFLGEKLGQESELFSTQFENVRQGITTLIRKPYPGLKYNRAIEGRRYLERYFRSQIEQRKKSYSFDLFTQMCQAKSEFGEVFTPQEIIDHMIFLFFAAYETTTIGITTTIWGLAENPEWQDAARKECMEHSINLTTLCLSDLEKLETLQWCFNEALRLYPPVPQIMRKTIKDTEYKGYLIPKNTPVILTPGYTHRLPDWWQDPLRFDPGRFAPYRAEHKQHPYCWIPFSGAAHTCIGMRFADMQAKSILSHMLTKYRFELKQGYKVRYHQIPNPIPKDGLMVKLVPL